MTSIPVCDYAVRNVAVKSFRPRPTWMITFWVTNLGCVLLIGILASLSCRGDVKATSKSAAPPTPRRTWAEVKLEIDAAFAACDASTSAVMGKQHPRSVSIGGTCGGSIRPTTSVMELVFDRHPSGRPREAVIILDIRVERDYSGELGQASAFRIVCNTVRDEGQEMVAGMVSFFEKKKWPYEIIDPKKKEKPDVKNLKGDSGKKSSP